MFSAGLATRGKCSSMTGRSAVTADMYNGRRIDGGNAVHSRGSKHGLASQETGRHSALTASPGMSQDTSNLQ